MPIKFVDAKSWSLRNKIVLHLLAIGGLAAVLLALIFIKTQRDIVLSMTRQQADLVASMIENSIFSFMKEGKVENVQSTLENISGSESIKKIRIISTEGIILRSSESAEVGSPAGQPLLQKGKGAFAAERPSPASSFFLESSIVAVRPIENKSECFGCHSPQTKTNGLLVVDIDYSAAAALYRTNQIKGALIALGSLSLLIVVILRLFEKLINRPILQLKKRMEAVQDGNLDVPVLSLNDDEIGTLARSFNVMVDRLREANQNIRDLYKKQIQKAEHLASIGELTAGLAHEIKNPIAGIKGALEVIHNKTGASDPRREVFAEILFQIDRIHNIIQDLLSYARPKNINVSLASPNACIRNAIRLAQPQINGKAIQFHFTPMREDALAVLDTNKIQELVLNMMLNSISAIEKEGKIEIRLQESKDKELIITVMDDGAGIKEDILPQIFKPFFTTKPRGTGLGLSICQTVIEAHKGSLEVKSQVGRGTSFTIRLPVLQPLERPC